MSGTHEPIVHAIYDLSTGTWQYIVADPDTRRAAIIDPVLDFDNTTSRIATGSADALLQKVALEGYEVDLLLETHLHADHISAAFYLREALRQRQSYAPQCCIGSGIEKMQRVFGDRYGTYNTLLPHSFHVVLHLVPWLTLVGNSTGVDEDEWFHAFDRTWADGDSFQIGGLQVTVLHLPGHTPDHIGYQIGSNVFCGDSIFNPDLGSARCDFPSGSAVALWNSMQRLLSLPPDYKLYTGHDYPPAGRLSEEGESKPQPYATVQEHKSSNKHVKMGVLEAEFVELRTTRDGSLREPKLMHEALQFNIRAGRMPKQTADGERFVRLPLRLPESLTAV